MERQSSCHPVCPACYPPPWKNSWSERLWKGKALAIQCVLTYADACGGRIVCESSFKMVWKKYVPHIQHQAHDGLMLDL